MAKQVDNLTHLIAQTSSGRNQKKVIRMIDQEHLMVMSDSEWQWVQENLSRTQRIESEAAQMTSVDDLDRVISYSIQSIPPERWPWLTGGPNENFEHYWQLPISFAVLKLFTIN